MPLIDPNQIPFKPLNGVAHQSVTLDATVFTYNAPLQANRVAIQALVQNIRFTLDGSAPTTATGFQLKAGDPVIQVFMDDTVTLRFIREASGAILEIQAGA